MNRFYVGKKLSQSTRVKKSFVDITFRSQQMGLEEIARSREFSAGRLFLRKWLDGCTSLSWNVFSPSTFEFNHQPIAAFSPDISLTLSWGFCHRIPSISSFSPFLFKVLELQSLALRERFIILPSRSCPATVPLPFLNPCLDCLLAISHFFQNLTSGSTSALQNHQELHVPSPSAIRER